MKKINLLFTALLMIASYNVNAQKVKLKKGKVLLEKIEILKYEKTQAGNNLSIYNLDDDELIFVKRNVSQNPQNTYATITFLEMNLSFETSSDLTFFKRLINRLLKDKVITDLGAVDKEKAKRFAEKYDENITDRTILIRN